MPAKAVLSGWRLGGSSLLRTSIIDLPPSVGCEMKRRKLNYGFMEHTMSPEDDHLNRSLNRAETTLTASAAWTVSRDMAALLAEVDGFVLSSACEGFTPGRWRSDGHGEAGRRDRCRWGARTRWRCRLAGTGESIGSGFESCQPPSDPSELCTPLSMQVQRVRFPSFAPVFGVDSNPRTPE